MSAFCKLVVSMTELYAWDVQSSEFIHPEAVELHRSLQLINLRLFNKMSN